MYKHKRGVELFDEDFEYVEPHYTVVRYAVNCTEDGTPRLFKRKDILPHQGGDPEELFLDIRCPRNIRFAPDNVDLDRRQWAHSTLPAEKFEQLYELVEQ